jgi:hypothetical protein
MDVKEILNSKQRSAILIIYSFLYDIDSDYSQVFEAKTLSEDILSKFDLQSSPQFDENLEPQFDANRWFLASEVFDDWVIEMLDEAKIEYLKDEYDLLIFDEHNTRRLIYS